MPLLLLLYVQVQITRFNISFAKLQFLKDLNLGEDDFGFAASAFYVGYILFQVPVSVLVTRFGVRRMLLCMMIAWGMVGSLMAFARSGSDLHVLRFLLGAAQGGFFPTVVFYLRGWFPDRLRGRVNGILTTAIPLGGIVAGPLAALTMGGLDNLHGLRGWQWLFLLQGVATMLLGMVGYMLLTDGPRSARWLSDYERQAVLEERFADEARRIRITQKSYSIVARDPVLWLLGAIYFGYFCALNALNLWGPSLLERAGAGSIAAVGWISGFSTLVALAGMLAIGWSSDRLQERRWHLAVCGLIAAGFFLLLPWAADRLVATAVLLILATTVLYPMLGLFWTIPGAYLDRGSAARGYAIISTLGAFGGIVSPALVGWVQSRTGSPFSGMAAIAVLLTLSMLALLLFGPVRGRGPSRGAGEA
jgi:sugar phosphate permease